MPADSNSKTHSNHVSLIFEHTISSMTSTPEYRVALAARPRGQTIVVPDVLRTIYNNPTVRYNDTEYLSQLMEPWLERYVPTESQRAKQRKVNTPLISSTFWTRVPRERLEALGSLMAWFFMWDDEVNLYVQNACETYTDFEPTPLQIDCGSLTLDNDGRTDAYCNDAIVFITSCMQPELGIPRPALGRLHHSGCFVDIGAVMQTGQTRADCDRFVETLVAYMNSARAGQKQRNVGVDCVDDFIDRRVDNIGVIPTLCSHAWGYGIKLPEWVWDHESAKVLMREVSVALALYNDVASLKKEVIADEVDSIVPILVHHHNVSAQEAVDMTMDMLKTSYQKLLAAVERLNIAVASENDDVKRDLKVWVDACVDLVFGNVAWSLANSRYLLRTALRDGSSGFEVVL
jgi:hypothetical protein